MHRTEIAKENLTPELDAVQTAIWDLKLAIIFDYDKLENGF